MLVKVKYFDNSSLTVEEAAIAARSALGDSAKIEVHPDSPAPHDLILFALQAIITHRQLSYIYDNKHGDYHTNLANLRKEVITDLTELVDTVLIENESKVSV